MIVISLMDGRILRTVFCPPSLRSAQCQSGETWLDMDADQDTQYINIAANPPVLVDRPLFSITHNGLVHAVNDVFKINNIPAGTQFFVAGNWYAVNDGFIEWASSEPGSFPMILEKFPFQRLELNATVT